jgi:hypothetical protein
MEREAALIAREKQLKETEERLKAIDERSTALEQAKQLLRTNASEFVRKFAPDADPADLAKQLWYSTLGDNAPPEFRAEMQARAAAHSVKDELRAEFEDEKKRFREGLEREQAEQAFHQYIGSIGSFATSVPDEYPLVQRFAKESPERVRQGLLKVAQNHAQATGGAVLTPAECAAKLNEELSALAKVIAPTPAPAAEPPSTQTATLRNHHQSVQPSRTLPDPSDEDAKFQAAMDVVRKLRAGQ